MRDALLGIEHPHSLTHLGTLQVLPEIGGSCSGTKTRPL